MKPKINVGALKNVRPWEHVVRFLFGGLVTVATGAVGRVWGPAVAGLLLAFPAILPASITLVKKHDGRAKAVDDARGARLGSMALALFAGVVASSAERFAPPLVLAVSGLVWLVAGTGLWAWWFGKESKQEE
jgi:hypothetical protein